MALSDCPECWSTPCICGSEYENKNFSKQDKIDMIRGIASGSSDHDLLHIFNEVWEGRTPGNIIFIAK